MITDSAPPTTAPLRVVVVGAGPMGRWWLRTVTESDEVELVGLVELDPDLAQRALTDAELDVPVVASVTALIEQGVTPDAVINVTVPRAHLPVNAEALQLGLPVLCEKPLSESLVECLQMAQVSEQTGQLLMVSQSRRYWPAVTALQSQIELIGPLELAFCEFAKAPRLDGFRVVMPQPLLVDMAIHHFDLSRKLLGADPVSVHAQSWNPSWSWFAGDACASATFTYDSGARFTYAGSWVSPGLETSWNGEWRLAGPTGSATWDGDHAPIMQTDDGEVVTAELGDEPDQIAGSLREFVHAVRTGTTPQGEVHSNITSIAMVLAAVRSAETGDPVVIADLIDQARAQV